MVYNRTDCALPHGYAEVGYVEYPWIGVLKIVLIFLQRVWRKIIWPILYRTLIVCRGYAFSYMNTMYEQWDLFEYSVVIQEVNEYSQWSLEGIQDKVDGMNAAYETRIMTWIENSDIRTSCSLTDSMSFEYWD